MRKDIELKYKDLKKICDPSVFEFKDTSELEPIYSGIGQERAIKALEFGVKVNIKGYNIYLEGPSGVGKTMYSKNYLDKVSLNMPVPDDWCYIYNFNNPNEPIAVNFPAGEGKVFKEMMDSFIKNIRNDFRKTFKAQDFEKEKSMIRQEYENKRTDILDSLNKYANKYGFQVRSTNNGVYMMPIINGKAIEEEEFEKLDEKVKASYEQNSENVQKEIVASISKIKELERSADKKIDDWQNSIAITIINSHINELKESYKRNKKLTAFFNGIKTDILKNLSLFIVGDKIHKNIFNEGMVPVSSNEPWLNYRVNLFIDNSESNGAPVIMDSNYNYSNIFGKIEYENYFGQLKTDHTMLQPGLMHIANGGYIIFQARDLIKSGNGICYEALKKAVNIKELSIENPQEQNSSMVMISLKPEPIPLNLKVLLIGTEEIYQTLIAMDDDFKKLFKIKVEFEDGAPKNAENMNKLARFIHGFCVQEDLPPLDPESVAKIVEFSSRLCEDQNKISTKFTDLAQIVGEAGTWALNSNKKLVTKEFIDKALSERASRVKQYDEHYMEMIKNKTLLIETDGYKIGQINGLTILQIGDYSFGKPVKITANTYIGKSGIVNIEREVELSGQAHSKGVMILTGYLGQKYAQDFPLSLTASVCFEQLYNGVDGDSATSTELYALLSSLSNIPINQSIAVTGSVNQKGEIQPIGGVNDKIEGFFQVCKMRGLNGKHGVLIPIQNVKNLNLNDEVVDAVKEGKFHIYAISTIDEGIEILTGVPAGKKNEVTSKFPPGTINYLAYEKLKKFSEKSR